MSDLCAVVSGSVLFIKEVIKYTKMETIIHHLSLSVKNLCYLQMIRKNPRSHTTPTPTPPQMVTSSICDCKLNARTCIRGDCHH